MGNNKTKTAAITLTRGGEALAHKINKFLNGVDIYTPQKLKNKQSDLIYFDSSLKKLTAALFDEYQNIVFIMSLGIVVRVIAPYLKNKREDPAVITIDETGHNVISTLSGHLGGANKLSRRIADKLQANAVITTATDCLGRPAFDILAQEMNCAIEPFNNLKLANAAIVNERPLSIFTDYPLGLDLKDLDLKADNIANYPLSDLAAKITETGFPVIISNKVFNICQDYLQLIPRNIIIGIGCRRGVAAGDIEAAVAESLNKLYLHEDSIKKLATIDLKENETGLIKYADKKDLEIDIIEREVINKSDLDITESEFVQKMVGVPGVCEPTALLSSTAGKLILPKTKYKNVTVAVVEEEIIYDR